MLCSPTLPTRSVYVGHRLDGYVTNYSISLQAGSTVLNTVSGSNSTIPAGTFAKVNLTYSTGATVTPGDLAIVLSSSGSQIDFDNVQLVGPATPLYFHPDHLSTRLTTDASGNLAGQQGHFPFGETWYAQNTTSKWQFTSYEHDSESGNDYAIARSYVNRLARFSTPDPAGLAAVDPTNPQSWNRYAYVTNNPIGLVDPLGLCGTFYTKDLKTVNTCGGGAGGGGSCTLDGVDTPCGLVSSLADAGALNVCSGGVCAPLEPVFPGSGLTGGIIAIPTVNYSQDPDLCIPNPNLCTTINFVNIGGNSSGGAAKNWGPANKNGITCNSITGICVPASMIPPPGYSPMKNAVKWYLCVNGALDNVRNYTLEGVGKGAAFGALFVALSASWPRGPARVRARTGQHSRRGGAMADLIAIVALGLQYSLIVFVINLWLRSSLPFSAVTITFLILGGIGMLLWHRKKLSQTVKHWGTLAFRSVVLGIAFLGADLLIALLNGQANPFYFPGGLLGLPLTFLICPGGTTICLAGLVRALYISGRAAPKNAPPAASGG